MVEPLISSLLLIFFHLLSPLSFCSLVLAADDGSIVSCYFQYNKPAIDDIDPHLCTHLNLINSFKHNETCDFVYPTDEELSDILTLKARNPRLKLLITLTPNNVCMSKLVVNDTAIENFVQEVTTFIHEKKVDGIDIDWEFPTWSGNASKTDKEGFVKLLNETRKSFDGQNPKPLLTVAVPGPYNIAKSGYDIPALNRTVDYVQLMNYDFHVYSKRLPFAGLNAPLFREFFIEFGFPGRMNSDYSTKYWLKNGISKEKILFGIPTYGRGYTLMYAKLHFIYAPVNGVSNLGDTVTYPQMCNLSNDSEYTYTFHKRSRSPYMYGKDKQWFSFENQISVYTKAKYAKRKGLAGIMLFDLKSDDFQIDANDVAEFLAVHLRHYESPSDIATENKKFRSSETATCRSGKYPLIRAAKLGFMGNSKIKKLSKTYKRKTT